MYCAGSCIGPASTESALFEITVEAVMHPVGPLNSRVYWLRRVSVIVAAVIVLIGVGFLVIQKTKRTAANRSGAAVVASGSSAPTLTGVLASRSASPPVLSASVPPSSSALSSSSKPMSATVTKTSAPSSKPTTMPASTLAAQTTAAKTTAAKTTAAKTTAATTPPAKAGPAKTTPPGTTASSTALTKAATSTTPPKPTSAAPPAPTTDAQGRLLCPDASLALVASTGAPSFAPGVQPTLGVSVRNTGAVTCTRDLSGGLQVFTVFSAAGARIWSTSDCFPGTGTDIRTLAAGQVEQYNIKWSGATSSPGCTAARVQVPAGRYQLRVDIGSLRATPAVFAIG
jgi:hypothetical protein